MTVQQVFYAGRGRGGVRGGSALGAEAQQLKVGPHDLGGVVTSANGPEAGVWVIAETTDLPTQLRQDRRHRRPGPLRACPICRRRNYNVWVRGYGLVDSPQGAGRARQARSTSRPCRRRTTAAAAQYYPAIYWYSMLQDSGQEPSSAARQRRSRRRSRSSEWLDPIKNRRLRRLPSARPAGDAHDSRRRLGEFTTRRRGLDAPHPVGPGGASMMVDAAGRQLGGAPFKYFGDWTDRIAKGELPHAQAAAAAGRRAQHRRHDLGLGQPDRHYLHDLISTDKRNPTVNAYGPLFGSPEIQHRRSADPRSARPTRPRLQRAGARPEHAGGARPRPRGDR